MPETALLHEVQYTKEPWFKDMPKYQSKCACLETGHANSIASAEY